MLTRSGSALEQEVAVVLTFLAVLLTAQAVHNRIDLSVAFGGLCGAVLLRIYLALTFAVRWDFSTLAVFTVVALLGLGIRTPAILNRQSD